MAPSSSNDPPLISIEEAKALSKLLHARGYFHGGTVPLTSQDASFLQPTPSLVLDPKDVWIVETTTGLCSVDRLREDFKKFMRERQRCFISDAVEHLGIDEATLQRYILGHEPSTRVFGTEIVLGQYLNETVEKLLAGVLLDDQAIHIVTELIDTKLQIPFDPAFALIQEKLSHFPALRLRRLDTGAWAIVTEAYLAELKRNLLLLVTAHENGPKSLKDFAKEQGWQVSWILQIIREDDNGLFLKLGDFSGDVFIPTAYTQAQKKHIVDLYSINGFVGAHMCQATFNVTASMMKHYLEDVEGTLVLERCVVSQTMVVEPLAVAIQECLATSSWLNLEPFLPLELLEHHREDVQDLLGRILPDSDHCMWIERSSAIMFSRNFINEVHENVMPRIIQVAAKEKAKQLQQEEAESSTTTTTTRTDSRNVKSGKEKHREREAAKAIFEAREIDVGQLSPALILTDLTERYPAFGDIEDESTMLKACEESFCTTGANEKYTQTVSSLIERAEKRKHALLALDNETTSSFESCFVDLCHLIQVRIKFFDHALSVCSVSTLDTLRRSLLRTTCRELVMRMTHNALVKANSDVSEFGLPHKFSNVDYASPVLFDANHFLSAQGHINETTVKRLRDHLSSSVAPLLIKLWNTMDISDENDVASQIDHFLKAADDGCLAICGMPFSKLDKKAEKRLLGIRTKQLQAHLYRASSLPEAIDLAIALLYQQVKSYVAYADESSRNDIVLMLSNERKTPIEKVNTIESVMGRMHRLNKSDEDELLEKIKELTCV